MKKKDARRVTLTQEELVKAVEYYLNHGNHVEDYWPDQTVSVDSVIPVMGMYQAFWVTLCKKDAE